MNQSSHQYEELLALCWACQAGELSDEKAKRLEQMVLKNDAACTIFVRYTALCANLEWEGVIELGPLGRPVEYAPLPKADLVELKKRGQQKQRKASGDLSQVLLMCLPAVLLISVGIFLYFGLFNKKEPVKQIADINPPANNTTSTNGKARIASAVDVRWKQGEKNWETGENIHFGDEAHLEQGLLELHFPTGVKLLITAPAIFQVTGKNEISLSQGMLLAEVLTEAGKGFTVKTPSSINVDLGTVFGVAVDQKGTSVTQVFQGIVNSTNNLSKENSSPSQTVQLTSNERILHRTDGTSTQGIKNLAELFFVHFDHSGSSSNKNRVAKLIGIDKLTAKNLRKQQGKNPVSITATASLEEEVLLSNKSPSNTNATAGFYNSFDNELAIEMGGAIKNAKQGPQHANLTYEDGGVLIKEGSRLSFETAGKLNNKKGHISFRIKPNWDGATDKQKRLFFSSGSLQIKKYHGGPEKHPKSYLVFKFYNEKKGWIETSSFYAEPKVLESWKKGTWHTIEVEWDLTLPLDQKYITLTIDHLFTGTITGSWGSMQPLGSTFTIGTNNDFGSEADAVFDEIHIDNEFKGNNK